MKFCTALLAILCMVSSFFVKSVRAEISSINFPTDIQQENLSSKKFEKLVLVPIKRKQIFGYSNEKLASEISYYFHKLGFKDSPVSHLIFENGAIIQLNKDWFSSAFPSNENKKVVLVLLVYEETYISEKFKPLIQEWSDSVLKPVLPFTLISDINAIVTGSFSVEEGETPRILFKNLVHITDFDVSFAKLDFKTKLPQQIKLANINIPENQKPDALFKVKIGIKNVSGYTAVLSSDSSLQFKFAKDSELFVNNVWLDKKTIGMYKDVVLHQDESKEYEISLRSPLIPGKVEEELIVLLGETEIAKQKIGFQVEDIGQKILKITTNSFDSIPVRQEPDNVSQEIAKTGRGQIHMYEDQKNGFFKIQVNDKHGWIPTRYAQIITK